MKHGGGARGRSRIAASFKMELFITVNGSKPLTIITKCTIVDVAAVLDPPLKGKERSWDVSWDVAKIKKGKHNFRYHIQIFQTSGRYERNEICTQRRN